MLYLIGHTKGGVGKTTIATNLAAYLAPARRVCLVDADEQLHSNRFCARRAKHEGLARIDCQVLSGSLTKRLSLLRRRYDAVIVDAGGADSEELRTAALAADVMLCPFSPSQNDLDGFDLLTDKVLTGARSFHPALTVLGLANMVETNAQRADRLPAARAYVEARGVTVLAASLAQLDGPYNRTAEEGRGLFELGLTRREGRALREFAAVVKEVQEFTKVAVLA